jgi:hypothetical protein
MNAESTENPGWREKMRNLVSKKDSDLKESDPAAKANRRSPVSPRTVEDKLNEFTVKHRNKRLDDFFDIVGRDDAKDADDEK